MLDAPPPLQLIELPSGLEESLLNPENIGVSPQIAWRREEMGAIMEPTREGSSDTQAPDARTQWIFYRCFMVPFNTSF